MTNVHMYRMIEKYIQINHLHENDVLEILHIRKFLYTDNQMEIMEIIT